MRLPAVWSHASCVSVATCPWSCAGDLLPAPAGPPKLLSTKHETWATPAGRRVAPLPVLWAC